MLFLSFLSPELPIELATYCYGCRECVRSCPVDAIHFLTLGIVEIDRKACWEHVSSLEDGECWNCSNGCRKDVLKMSLFVVCVDENEQITIKRNE